ncbi:transporter [Nesidiocoris tenuis]|uniref:Transporter n=1 Tax=Nesidiocoris tenuis TaxID=355587 RepID=A0ABN7AYF9_9HEMI|nr:transporter [Nesidiocoris tenuis]
MSSPRSPYSTPLAERTARVRIALAEQQQRPFVFTIPKNGPSIPNNGPPTPTNGWSYSSANDHMVAPPTPTSIGMGSTDGHNVTVRKVPTSPNELFNIPSVTSGEEDDDASSTCSYATSGGWDGSSSRRLKSRGLWENKMQFILAVVGYSVGLGNLWRFPYLSYASGGGVFLIPYYIILISCSVPLLYMELAIGQFTRRGPIGAFSKLCPIFKGAGVSSVIVAFFMSTYYNVIIAYTLYYLFASFHSDPPWNGCNNIFNTKRCWQPEMDNSTKLNYSLTPAEEFYNLKVLQVSTGIEEPGSLRWELAACLLFGWIFVYFALWKSVRSSGKVLYFTATLPFVLVLVFLGRALTLEGSELGLRYFFTPKWELLADSKVWVYAAAQNFYSIGIAFGSTISIASYNRAANHILVDTLTVSAINAVTSLIVGVFAFAMIGNIAMEHDTSIEDVVADGPGLMFIVYPQALSKMPVSSLWAVFFFFMLLCLGLNSQFAIVEVVVTSFQDGFPNWIKKKLICHEIVVLVICIISFLLGLPMITQGGIYVFQLVDHYALSNSIMPIAFFETIAIAWCYGAGRLSKNIRLMSGETPYFYFRVCWVVAAPSFILCVWIFYLVDYQPLKYDNGHYTYPWWADAIGWSITAICLLWIPLIAFYAIVSAEGTNIFQKFANSIRARIDDLVPEDADKTVKELLFEKEDKTPRIVKAKSLEQMRVK